MYFVCFPWWLQEINEQRSMRRMRKIQKNLQHTKNVCIIWQDANASNNTDKKVSPCEVDYSWVIYINIHYINKSIHMSGCTLLTTHTLQNKRIENIQINTERNKKNCFFVVQIWDTAVTGDRETVNKFIIFTKDLYSSQKRSSRAKKQPKKNRLKIPVEILISIVL